MDTSLAVKAALDLPTLVDDYLASCAAQNLSPETIKLYRHGLNRFMLFGTFALEEVDARLLRRFIFYMQSEGLSSSTVRDYFGHVKSFLGYLENEGILVGANPAKAIPTPRKASKLPRVLSEVQAQTLLDVCPDYTWTGRRDKTAIFLLLGSGLRLSELLSLNLYDLDLTGGEISVMGKGSKERMVSIDDDIISVLNGWLIVRGRVLKGMPQSAVFITRTGGRLGSTFAQSVKNYAASAGFHCTPHTCRHTYATDWIRRGGDLQRLKGQLGHSHLSMTEKYVHLARKDFKAAANKYSITKRLRFDSRQMRIFER